MKTNTKVTIAAAALTGLLAGATSRAMATTPTSTTPSTKLIAAGHQAITLDDTAKNSCKGQNSCQGKGGCKTGDNGCKGKNSCKGKGGCKTNSDAPAEAPKNL